MPSVTDAPNRNLATTTAFFEEWARLGAAHVCICPGSRSGPLAIAAAHSEVPHSVHLDERAAAFFALGVAKASRRPALVLCTSGTAAANFLPAVVEAHYARVPLIVLTADRPPELREWGAGQTIDQTRLFGSHTRWYAEAPLPEATDAGLRTARALACRAFELANGGAPGPVHLNLPFRDPLDPRRVDDDRLASLSPRAADGRGARPYATRPTAPRAGSREAIEAVATRFSRAQRGVVVAGPLDATAAERNAIVAAAERLGWPLLAEATSQLGGHGVRRGHALLSDPAFAEAHRPDAVLRFGDAPTSKAVARWLAEARPDPFVAVDPHGVWHDPDHVVTDWADADIAAWCDRLVAAIPSGSHAWRDTFEAADAAATRALEAELVARSELLEARVADTLVRELAPEIPLFVSSSMPVRDLDQFWPAGIAGPRVLCNRGANGIDGIIASAAGACWASGGPLVAYLGDLACLHDLTGLLAAKRLGLPLTLVVVDNDGGGIFSMLPVASFGKEASFDELFHTPHGHDLVRLAEGAGVACTRVSSWDHFSVALEESVAAGEPRMIVVPTEARTSVEQRRALQAAIGRAWASGASDV